MRRLASVMIVGFAAFALLCGACSDDNGTPADGTVTDGTVTDGPITTESGTDGPADDAPGDSTPSGDSTSREGGWVQDDQGTVVVGDGGVLITDDAGNQYACYPTKCAGKLLECGNCIDDDGDGLVDHMDPECLGPCDNTEGPGLESGVGGTVAQSCGVDCYFDYGNGPGNDQCTWDHRCDPLEPELPKCPYDATMVDGIKCPATQPQQCTDFCLPYTPNGCDCWGCCTFPALATADNGQPAYVWIGNMVNNVSTCTLADVTDTTKCPRCTPVQGCFNECGRCEICVGKPTVPPDCFAQPDGGVPSDAAVPDGGGVNPDQCPGGEQPCGLPGQAACSQGYYCISGCCIQVTID